MVKLIPDANVTATGGTPKAGWALRPLLHPFLYPFLYPRDHRGSLFGRYRRAAAKKCHFLLAFQAKRDILIFDYGCEEAD